MKCFAAKALSILLVLLMLISYLPADVRADDPSLQVGIVNYYSTDKSNTIITDSYYYTDDWFLEDPASRNDSLALLSMQLTAAASDDRSDGLGPAFLSELGFTETGYVCSDPDDPDGCNYTWGKKVISDGDETFLLVAIQIQSRSADEKVKETGWAQNFYVNGETLTDTHYGLSAAASNALPSIAALGDDPNVKFWVTGQSRGGAIANLVATSLGDAGNTVYAYTFEAPAVIENDAARECSYIHNYLCTDDIVTMLPPWGMTRNGDAFILNTEESNAAISAQLQKMGSSFAESAGEYLEASPEATGIKIMDALTSSIPTREEYSAVNTDVFTDQEGNEIRITYVYQDLFVKIAKIIFGSGIGEINTDLLLDRAIDLAPSVDALVSAVKEDSLPDYYRAAQGIWEFLPSVGIELPLSAEDLYVLLKLTGPALIDTSYEPQHDPIELGDMLGYLSPAIVLIAGAKTLVFSHHFDTLIARLKLLAPAPAFENLDIIISEPAAGDDVHTAPSEITDFVVSSGLTWLDASGRWETVEWVLEDDHVYYLSAEIHCTGYEIPEDFSVTLNGAEPAAAPSVSYEGGIYTIKARWPFTFGTPEKVRVSFDTGGLIADPDPVYVDAGSLLGYVLTPSSPGRAVNEEGTWQFDNWFDENGQFWEDIIAEQDITLHARWIGLIDKINIFYRIPHVGEALGEPQAEENAKYVIEDIWFVNSKWEDVTTAEDTEPVTLSFYVRAASEDYHLPCFWEDDMPYYDGTVTINGESGESITVDYSEMSSSIAVYYTFNPLPAEDTPTPTPAEDTPTPTPAEDTPTPTPAEDTPTPTPAEDTPTPTPAEDTPTPTPAEDTPTPTPAGDESTPVPPEDEPTPTPTDTPTPTPTGKGTVLPTCSPATPTPTGSAAVPTPTITPRPASKGTAAGGSTQDKTNASDEGGKENGKENGKETASSSGSAAKTNSVKTGDENYPVLWILLMAAAAGVLVAVSDRRKS